MIGKARLVSASPYRATLKVHKSAEQFHKDSDSEDDFQREDLPELQKSHISPIKDDSVILRNEKNDFLTQFSQSAFKKVDDNRSEGVPQVNTGDLKGIMINESRTSLQRNANYQSPATRHNRYHTEVDDSILVMQGQPLGPHVDHVKNEMMRNLPRPGDFMGQFKQRSSQLRGERELQLLQRPAAAR